METVGTRLPLGFGQANGGPCPDQVRRSWIVRYALGVSGSPEATDHRTLGWPPTRPDQIHDQPQLPHATIWISSLRARVPEPRGTIGGVPPASRHRGHPRGLQRRDIATMADRLGASLADRLGSGFCDFNLRLWFACSGRFGLRLCFGLWSRFGPVHQSGRRFRNCCTRS
jgi:hypothetical protein